MIEQSQMLATHPYVHDSLGPLQKFPPNMDKKMEKSSKDQWKMAQQNDFINYINVILKSKKFGGFMIPSLKA